MDREGFELRQVKFSRMAPQRDVTLNGISVRTFGENVIVRGSPG